MTPGQILALAGTVLGIAGIVSLVIVYVRANMAKTTIDLYKEDNAALRTRMDTLEKDKAALTSEVNDCKLRIESAERANKVLADQVTGTSAVEKLKALVVGQHREVLDMLRLMGIHFETRASSKAEGLNTGSTENPGGAGA